MSEVRSRVYGWSACLVEQGDHYPTVWHVKPPESGRSYVVTECEWAVDYTERHVFAWRYADED